MFGSSRSPTLRAVRATLICAAILSRVASASQPVPAEGQAGDAETVPSPSEDAPKPNFIFILIDDLGWTGLGCYGNEFHETPRLDALAQQGMRFTGAYTAGNVCSPTRASILTGKHPAQLHITKVILGSGKAPRQTGGKLREPDWQRFLPLTETTLAEALEPAGYVSVCIGKWHLGGTEHSPERQGFDHVPSPRGASPDGMTDALTEAAEAFLESNKHKAFFLYLAHNTVHGPLKADADLVAKYESKAESAGYDGNPTYAAMVEHLDDSVGRLLDKLESLRIADRTVFIFFSDNGGHARFISNAPLRAGKGDLYEGGVRVPLIVRWPGVIRPGSVCDEPVISMDFFPTLLEIAGVSPGGGPELAGVSLVPLLRGTGRPRRDALYWHVPHYFPWAQHGTPCGAVREGDYKLIEFYESSRVELYNLKEDVGESVNLAERMPAKAAVLAKKLADWRRSVGAQMPTPIPTSQSAPHRQPPRRKRGSSPPPTTQPNN